MNYGSLIRSTELDVSRETAAELSEYVDMLARWQKKTNLVASSTIADAWSRHILDSVQCLKIQPNARIWADFGSGGGFPGMVIAILLRENDDAMIHLVESNGKKCAFLREVARQTGAKARIHNGRIESITKQLSQENEIEVVTARALASFKNLLTLSKPLFEIGATGLFHKGRDYAAEIVEAEQDWRFDYIVHKSQIEQDSVLVEVSNVNLVK